MADLATTRRFTWAASTAIAVILSGCQVRTTESLPPPTTVRLTDDGCQLEGNAGLTMTGFQLRVVNETDDLFSVQLFDLTAGRLFDDVVVFNEGVQAAVDAGQPVPTPPPWMTEVARQEVGAGQEADLQQTPGTGSYTIVCGRIHPPDDLFRVMTIGPIEVTESQ